MKKFYTVDEIRLDFEKFFHDLPAAPENNKNNLLHIDTFSNHLIDNYGETLPEDIDLYGEMADYISSSVFPICDFTGHDESDYVLIGVSGPQELINFSNEADHAKIIFGKKTGITPEQLNTEEAVVQYRNAMLENVVNAVRTYGLVIHTCIIVDFTMKVVKRIPVSKVVK